MQKYKRIKSLVISHLKVSNLDFLLLFPNLESVQFYGCTIADYTTLRKVSKLKFLFFNTIRTSNDNFNFLSHGFENLEWLSISYCPKFEVFPNLSVCKNLKMLEIRRCKSLIEVQNIRKIPNLEGISFSVYNKLDPADLEFIIQMPDLKLISCYFPIQKQEQLFNELCLKHGKTKDYDLVNDKDSPKFVRKT